MADETGGTQDAHAWVIVPPDEKTQGREALADSDTLSPEGLEDLLEGAPPAFEELVHETDPVEEALLDEGQSLEGLDEEEVETAVADRAGREETATA